MSIKDDFLRGLLRLRPPHIDASQKEMHGWRWTIALFTGANAVTLAAHVALACGFVPAVFAGFAAAEDVRSLQVQRATDLSLNILATKEKQCLSAADERVQALYRESIARMEMEYEKLMGKEFDTPTCAEFRG